MEKISEITNYEKNGKNYSNLTSPYMDVFMVCDDVKFSIAFNHFLFELALEDATYKGVESENKLENSLKKLIDQIKTELSLYQFKKRMKSLSELGELGKILYERLNINDLKLSLKKSEKFELDLYDIIDRVEDEIRKSKKLDDSSSLEEYLQSIQALSNLEDELDNYEGIESLSNKVTSYNKKIYKALINLKEKIAFLGKVNTPSEKENIEEEISEQAVTDKKESYSSCKLAINNPKAVNLCKLLISRMENEKVTNEEEFIKSLASDVFGVYYSLNTEEEVEVFLQFMEQLRDVGELGKKLYESPDVAIEEMNYEELVDLKADIQDLYEKDKENQKSKIDAIDDMFSNTMEEYEVIFKKGINLDELDELLRLLYEYLEMIRSIAKNISDQNLISECINIETDILEKIDIYESTKQKLEEIQDKYVF